MRGLVVATTPFMRGFLLPRLVRANIPIHAVLRALPRRGSALDFANFIISDIPINKTLNKPIFQILSESHPTNTKEKIYTIKLPQSTQKITDIIKAHLPNNLIDININKTTNFYNIILTNIKHRHYILLHNEIYKLPHIEYRLLTYIIKNWLRDSFYFSYTQLQQELNYSPSTIQAALSRLKNRTEPPIFSVFTIYKQGYWIKPHPYILA